MFNPLTIKKKALELQEKLASMQEEVKKQKSIGRDENNLVEITISGEKSIEAVKLDEKCLELKEISILEESIKSAYKNAVDNLPPAQDLLKDLNINLPF